MILLYTGASSNNAPQINAEKSLGGYVSGTPIPNGRLANIFPTISKSDVIEGKSLIRMIVLKNTTGASVNVTINSVVTNSHIKLKIAAVAPAIDSNNNPVFESVYDGHSLPYQATLEYHEANDPINVGAVANNAVVGIWILREIDKSKFPEFNPELTGDELIAAIEASQNVNEETVSLQINY